MWRHETRQTVLYLCVDDFIVKYFNKDDADRLLNTLGKEYKYTVDWTCYNICDLTFERNYKYAFVDITIPD